MGVQAASGGVTRTTRGNATYARRGAYEFWWGRPLGSIRFMNDAELIADFTRTVGLDGGVHLQVAVVKWPEPHQPTLAWTTIRRWKQPPSPERLAAARQKALTMPRYFRVCQRCGERKNVGHMHNRDTCQCCAERHLGVVY